MRWVIGLRGLALGGLAGLSLGAAWLVDVPQASARRGTLETSSTTRPRSDQPTYQGLELVVFERLGCNVCTAFRNRVAPTYMDSDMATRVPLRYVDIDTAPIAQRGLGADLTMLPTVVLMRDGDEIARLSGLVAPDAFLEIIDGMVGAN